MEGEEGVEIDEVEVEIDEVEKAGVVEVATEAPDEY